MLQSVWSIYSLMFILKSLNHSAHICIRLFSIGLPIKKAIRLRISNAWVKNRLSGNIFSEVTSFSTHISRLDPMSSFGLVPPPFRTALRPVGHAQPPSGELARQIDSQEDLIPILQGAVDWWSTDRPHVPLPRWLLRPRPTQQGRAVRPIFFQAAGFEPMPP